MAHFISTVKVLSNFVVSIIFQSNCVGMCVDRYVKYNQRLMFTFMEFQNTKQEAVIKEIELAAAEGRQPNIPGLGQAVANPLMAAQQQQVTTSEGVPYVKT